MKKAILAVSYGSSYPEAIMTSILKIENTFHQTVPDFDVFRAFTGKKIIHALEQKGVYIDSLEEALQQLSDQQYDIVVVQPTHLMHGTEYGKIQRTVAVVQDRFKKILLGTPLINTQDDFEPLCKIIVKRFYDITDCVLLAGHGSAAENSKNLYLDINRICKQLGYPDVYAAAMESSPTLDEILFVLKNRGYHSVGIVPLMVTAGKHTCRDIMGDANNSWKSRLEQEGFSVVPIMRGLGEYEEVRALYSEHLRKICDSISL